MRTNLTAAYAASTLEQQVEAAKQRRRELAARYQRNDVLEQYFALGWEEQQRLLIGQPTLRMEIAQYREEKAAHEAENAERNGNAATIW